MPIKFFEMSFGDLDFTLNEVWRKQIEQGKDPTAFKFSGIAFRSAVAQTIVWTDEQEGQDLFREVLIEHGVRFWEFEIQQAKWNLKDLLHDLKA